MNKEKLIIRIRHAICRIQKTQWVIITSTFVLLTVSTFIFFYLHSNKDSTLETTKNAIVTEKDSKQNNNSKDTVISNIDNTEGSGLANDSENTSESIQTNSSDIENLTDEELRSNANLGKYFKIAKYSELSAEQKSNKLKGLSEDSYGIVAWNPPNRKEEKYYNEEEYYNIDTISIPSSINGKKISFVCSNIFVFVNIGKLSIGQDIVLDDNAFNYCSSQEITLKSGVKLNWQEFNNKKLKKLTIGDNVSFNSGIFNNCANPIECHISTKNEYRIVYNNLVCSKDESKLLGILNTTTSNLIIPNKIKIIGKGAFQNCRIDEITIPNSVEKIEPESFLYSFIETLNFEEGFTTIGESAFSSCHIGKINLPNTLKVIGKSAFNNCMSYNGGTLNITFPKGLEIIEEKAFAGSDIRKVNIPGSVKKLGDYAFDTFLHDEIILHEGLESIGKECFRSEGLLTINIPSTVKEVGNPFMFEETNCIINVSKENPYFLSDDSGMYSKDGKRLIWLSSSDGLMKIREGCEEIPEYYIAYKFEQSGLLLPSSIKKIHMNLGYIGFEIEFLGKVPPKFYESSNPNSYDDDKIKSETIQFDKLIVPKGAKEAYIKAFKVKEKYYDDVIEQ